MQTSLELTHDVMSAIEGHDRVKVGGFDIDGIFRGKYLSMDKFKSILEGGFGFCDVIFGWDSQDALYDNVQATGWHTGYPDIVARIDPESLRQVPWDGDVPMFLVDFCDREGNPFEISPRQVLKRTVSRCQEMGYEPLMGAEFEFFFFKETPWSVREKGYRNLQTLSPGMFGYSILRASASQPLVDDLFTMLRKFRIDIEGFHTETGPGVFEAAIRYDNAVEAADRAALFKTAVKEIAARHGVMATFMAKWNAELPGCSGHIHQSLHSIEHAHNAFYDATGPNGMSQLFMNYVAGQIAHMGELMPMVAPTINSYKRTVPGHWAPTTVTWAVDNRTSALRVIPGSPKSTRLEFRLSGADMNPYLAFAACLAGGMSNLDGQYRLPPAITGNAYDAKDMLPQNLAEATDRFRNSPTARDWFGDAFVDHFAATRDWEVRAFRKAVTDWELARYFEII